MKKIFFTVSLILSAILLGSTISHSAPFLACDIPSPDQQVMAIKGRVDGVDFTTPYTERNGRLVIYDIGPLSPAKHTFTELRAVNIRGESTTVPFDLPAMPGSLSNIGLIP